MGEDIDVSTEAVWALADVLDKLAIDMDVYESEEDLDLFTRSQHLCAETSGPTLRALAADRDAARAALTDAIAERDAALAEVGWLRVTPTPAREVASLALSFLEGFKGGDMPLVEGMAELKRWLRVCAEIGESAYGDVEDPDA